MMRRAIQALLGLLLLANLATAQVTTNPGITNVPATRGQLPGTTTNDNACAGCVGEQFTTGAIASTNFPANSTMGDLGSITLTPGDWDLTAHLDATVNGATVTVVIMGISSTTGNSFTGLTQGDNQHNIIPPTAASDSSGTIAAYRVQPTTNTTYYLKYYAAYTVATPKAMGKLTARRMR